MLRGLQRLRMPDLLVQIMGFMIRYLDVVTGEMGRMIDGDALARLRPALAAALAGAGPLARRAVHPLLRARRAGAPRDAVARLHRHPARPGAPDAMSHPRPRRTRPGATPTPTATRRCSASTCTSTEGERVALLGPNGAGKTTLVLHLNGILTAGAGIGRGQRDAGREGRTSRRSGAGSASSSRTPTTSCSWPRCAQDVAFGPANLGVKGAELDRRVIDALDQVGMADFVDRPPHHLSFGQRRRVAVATVLAMEPEILVLDEPSSNLDPASRRELADILRSLDVTVLMVTHDLPYALELCPRSVVLSDGVVVADGATYDVLTDDALMRAPPAGAAVRVRSAGRSVAVRGATLPRSLHRDDREQRRCRPSSARSRRPASAWRPRSTSSSTARTRRRSSGARSPSVKAHFVDPQTGQPRTDNILKVVGGVVGVVALFVRHPQGRA